jgi:hypothetical protein
MEKGLNVPGILQDPTSSKKDIIVEKKQKQGHY